MQSQKLVPEIKAVTCLLVFTFAICITGCESDKTSPPAGGEQAERTFEPPLYKAAEKNDVVLIKQLLADGANINLTSGKDAETPLHRAISRNSIAAAKLLIEEGADFNKPRSDGQTPLEMATSRNCSEILAFLRELDGLE
jgi:ankyrin repeat protein